MYPNKLSYRQRDTSEKEKIFEEFMRDRALYVKWCKALETQWVPPEKVFDNIPLSYWLSVPISNPHEWKDTHSEWLMYLTILNIKD